jgi:hypothetical protein
MKNILARGGIEFLAVIMGISGSLWLDDNNTYKNDRKQEYEEMMIDFQMHYLKILKLLIKLTRE